MARAPYGSTVLIIPSRELGWAAIRDAVRAAPEIARVVETPAISRARALAVAHRPDVIIMNRIVEETWASTVARELRRIVPEAGIVVVSGQFDAGELAELAQSGVNAYLLWRDLSVDVLHHCLALLCTGTFMIGSRAVGQAFIEGQIAREQQLVPPVELGDNERFILNQLGQGLTEDEIAREVHLSRRTVRRITANLKGKLDAPSLFVLGMRASEFHLVT